MKTEQTIKDHIKALNKAKNKLLKSNDYDYEDIAYLKDKIALLKWVLEDDKSDNKSE